MDQLPMGPEQPRRGPPAWVAWAATIAAASILLVVIVIAATVDGVRIRAEMWEKDVLRTGVPARETVYAESIPASPTVILAPQASTEISVLETAFKSVAVNTALRSGPGTEFAITKYLVAGERVQVLTAPIEIQGQQWQRVRAGEDQVGWCLVNELISVGTTE